MKKYEFLWILPNLNEDIRFINKNIDLIITFSRRYFKSFKVIIMDGGSSGKNLWNLSNKVSRYSEANLFLVLPTLRPTKNKGILDASRKFESENTAIIDIDCENLNEAMLKKLVMPVVKNKAKLSLPRVKKSGGRGNQLVCNPLLAILFPEVSKKTNYPLSGIISLKSKILKNSIKKDYFWDWGGEIQIVIRTSNKNKVNEFIFKKVDKKRDIKSKKDDARQFLRAIVYESIKDKKLNKGTIEKMRKSFQKYKNNAAIYESYLIEYLVVDVVREILFNQKNTREEINVDKRMIDDLKLRNLKKYLIFMYLEYLQRFLSHKENITFFMNHCNKILETQKDLNTDSVEIVHLGKNILKNISEIYNGSLSPRAKIKNILNIIN
jgi:hypothetical protein